MLLEFSPTRHEYYADGVALLSVTHVLDKAGLVPSFCKDADAAARGQVVHALTAKDDAEGISLAGVMHGFRGYCRAWRSFRRDHKFTPTLIEQRVYDIRAGYAGTYDRLGHYQGFANPVVVDIKSNKTGAAPEYVRYQLAAYAVAAGHPFAARACVVVMPSGKYKFTQYPVVDLRADYGFFLNALKQTKLEVSNAGN